eukprot:scaffold1220_cov259-Pinguiococcus_pyrenoidosus.AAC.160
MACCSVSGMSPVITTFQRTFSVESAACCTPEGTSLMSETKRAARSRVNGEKRSGKPSCVMAIWYRVPKRRQCSFSPATSSAEHPKLTAFEMAHPVKKELGLTLEDDTS